MNSEKIIDKKTAIKTFLCLKFVFLKGTSKNFQLKYDKATDAASNKDAIK